MELEYVLVLIVVTGLSSFVFGVQYGTNRTLAALRVFLEKNRARQVKQLNADNWE